MTFRKENFILSVILTVIALVAYAYLFVYADRKIVFLYGHLGLTPYDRMTSGRYWMAGLVISGFLTIIYLSIKLIVKQLTKKSIFSWGSVIKYAVIPLTAGIVILITQAGEPRLSFITAISSALALEIGIAAGFSVTDDLVKNYRETIVYLISSLGLIPFLLLFRVLELPEKGILTMELSILTPVISFAAGFIWLFLAYRVFRPHGPGWINVLKGSVFTGYIGLPLVHYLFATPKGIPYITSADNFFADKLLLRTTNWLLLILLVFLADKLSKRVLPGKQLQH
ncbi:MAG: hypothetical protein JNL22_07320 [Bacteroidales bacterium]|nr:hypothetical protein [Bacteroidales bacterium]